VKTAFRTTEPVGEPPQSQTLDRVYVAWANPRSEKGARGANLDLGGERN